MAYFAKYAIMWRGAEAPGGPSVCVSTGRDWSPTVLWLLAMVACLGMELTFGAARQGRPPFRVLFSNDATNITSCSSPFMTMAAGANRPMNGSCPGPVTPHSAVAYTVMDIRCEGTRTE